MKTRQARRGGEFGANGEWYESGKFINTVPENPKRHGSRTAKARKAQIAPFEWAVVPDDKAVSIYSQLAGIYGRVENGRMVLRTDDRMADTLAYYGRTLEEVQTLALRWNQGERWA